MKNKNHPYLEIALPITLQSLFQASFSVIDQLMTGQLGTVNVAGIGLGGKFSGLYTVVISAVVTAAGILIAQFEGKQDEKGVNRCFTWHLTAGVLIAGLFTLLSMLLPVQIISLYTTDKAVQCAGGVYLYIVAIGFLPMTASLMLSAYLRCKGMADFPLYASVLSAVLNTGLNYLLIFGKFGFPQMGVRGAAIATTVSRIVEFVILLCFVIWKKNKEMLGLKMNFSGNKAFFKMVISVLTPILVCEFLWCLGENVYAVIYARIGTESMAAMTLTNPIQSIMIGAMTGISQAAGIITGKRLGENDVKKACGEAGSFLKAGIIGSAGLSLLLVLLAGDYVNLYQVEDSVKDLTVVILYVYAFIAPVKVENMILAGGILRSGGRTDFTMGIDIVGTWCFGVPLGLLGAYVLKLPIYGVYFLLSLEEVVRLMISIWIFRKGNWIKNLTEVS